METTKAPASGETAFAFEDYLPPSTDPAKQALRIRLVELLNSHNEVVPAAESPLQKLWKLMNSTDTSLADCEDIILLDPALTTRIFRVANSAAYQANASTVSEAIRFVGFKVIRQFVFNAGVFDQFSGLGVPPGWDLFWLRNIFVARMTERIFSIYKPANGTEYLAGLTHDVGWLFLAAYAPEEFATIWDFKGRITDAEFETLPFSHANLGAAIAAKSSFPPRVVDAILYHHRQSVVGASTGVPAQNPRLLEVVMGVADRIADGSQLDLFARSTTSLDAVLESPEVLWLKTHGKVDFGKMITEELQKAQDLYSAFFSE